MNLEVSNLCNLAKCNKTVGFMKENELTFLGTEEETKPDLAKTEGKYEQYVAWAFQYLLTSKAS